MKYFILSFIILIICLNTGKSNNIEISNVSFDEVNNELSFDFSLDNSFYLHGDVFMIDGAWFFIKYAPNGGDSWHHAPILDSVPVSGLIQYIASTDLGIAVYGGTIGTGTLGPYTLTLTLGDLLGSYQDFRVFGTEIIYFDQKPFYAGDESSPGRFYMDGDESKPLYISNENALTRGSGVGEFDQEGSSSNNNIAENFPKGYESSWGMKYKITTKQYLDFLNSLNRNQQANRIESDISGATISNRYVMSNSVGVMNRNPIKCDANVGTGPIQFYLDLDDDDIPNEANDGAHLAMNYLSPADILAYLDWSGLRPMTELEYERMCRGANMPPVPGEYAWGTPTFNAAGSLLNSGSSSEITSNVGILSSLFNNNPLRTGYAATATSGRTDAGATFWGNMDVHNLGEFMLSVNSLNFTRGSYGDGELSSTGQADVNNWVTGAEYLSTENSSSPLPVSEGKMIISPFTRRADMGGRGVIRLLL